MNTPKQPSVVFVGHVVIDHNKVEQMSYVRWGSPAMFMMRYFRSNFALNPAIIASYGPDFLEYASGVTLLPKKPNLERSTVYENIVTNGHRTQYCHGGDAALPELDAAIKAALAGADLLFLAPLTPAYSPEYVARFMAHVPKGCLKVLLPQGYLRHITPDDLVEPREFAEAADILPHFDLAVLSDEDQPKVEAAAQAWKGFSPKTEIIVTRNVYGADIVRKGSPATHIPTTPVPPEQIVDSVGLGDIFSAATAYEYYVSHNLEKAVRTGHAAAREKLLSPKVI